MINLPGSWVLDDAVYFQFHITIRTAMRRAADVLEIYKEEFRAVHAVGGLFTLVMHPQLSGRPSRVLMLKEFMDYVKGFDDVWLPSPIDVVEYWRSEHKLAPSAAKDKRENDRRRRIEAMVSLGEVKMEPHPICSIPRTMPAFASRFLRPRPYRPGAIRRRNSISARSSASGARSGILSAQSIRSQIPATISR